MSLGTGAQVDYVNLDALIYWIPLMREAAAQWRQGSVPLWNPYQGLGTPLLATLQAGAGYPLNAAYLVCDGARAWLVTTLAHQLIAAVGMYALCRALRLSRQAAVVGAAAYTFSPAVLAKYLDQPQFNSMTWVPALFWAAERLLARARWRSAVPLAVIWALQILAGHPEVIAYSAALLAAYIGARLLGRLRRAPAQALRLGLAAAAAAALALGLAAFQLLPLAELVPQSVRAAGSLSPAQQGIFSAIPSQLLTVQGPLPLGLALAGVWGWRRKRLAWLFAVLAIALAVLAAGPATPLFAVLAHLPIGGSFRAPARWLSLWPLCVTVLVAAAADELMRCAPAMRARSLRTLACAALFAAVLRAAFTRPWSVPWLWGPIGLEALVPLFAWAGFRLAKGNRQGSVWGDGVVLVLVLLYAAPMAVFHWGPSKLSLNGVVSIYERERPLFAALRAAVPARVLSVLPVPGWPYTSWAKLGSYFEVPVLNDVEPLSLRAFRTFVEALRGDAPAPVTTQGIPSVFMGEVDPPLQHYDMRLLSLAGVRFVLAASTEGRIGDKFAPGALQPWRRGAEAAVYENRDAQPRAFFMARDRARLAEPECARSLRDPSFNPADAVLLNEVPATESSGGAGASAVVQMVDYAPAGVRVRVTADAPGYVVLTDAAYPGWTATVAGVPTPILTADCVFRAVAVPAGSYEVVFRYAPESFRRGVAVSLVSFAVVLVVLVTTRVRTHSQKAPRETL